MEVLDYNVVRSLKKSRIRKDVLLFLLKIYPEGSYIAEIALKIGADPSNVIGAPRGSNRYKEAMSLVSMGLVDGDDRGEIRFYRLSDKGVNIAQVLNGS